MVYNYAMKKSLKGYVCNAGDGLHVEVNATEEDATRISAYILQHAPPLAKIVAANLQQITYTPYQNFSIKESSNNGVANLPLTPDYALCNDCRNEIHNNFNPRYRYPFTTCTQCGPRFSVIQAMPYDRPNTAMSAFNMCSDCEKEYNNNSDRRYFSQTNSCRQCGVVLSAYETQSKKLEEGNTEVLLLITNLLQQGKILAVKGIGGYLLICDAANREAIELLRRRKHRPHKPFAIMCKDETQVKSIAYCNEAELQMLKSAVTPIVLLKAKEESTAFIAAAQVAPNLSSIGIMLPYAPLFEIVLNDFGKPIVATSANISNAPIIYKDDEALENLFSIADVVITHNREIVTPQDDSVIRFSQRHQQQIIIRRGRGLSPSCFDIPMLASKSILAAGALMKSSFTVFHQNNIYVSQYLGSTESYDAQQTYEKTYQHYQSILQIKPEVVLADKHPDYFATQFAKEISLLNNAHLYQVQHHKAHFAGVLAENNLLGKNKKVLGVIWDGTGLGDDDNIWGGEFFLYTNNTMQRCYYFDYFPGLLGDKMAREPRVAALSICNDVMSSDDFLKHKFTSDEWSLYTKILAQDNLLQTSSCGRIFDAVASLLGLCDKQSYEGEAALLLENIAQEYFLENGYAFAESYFVDGAHYYRLPTATLCTGIIRDIAKGKPIPFIAAKFHYSLIHCIKIIVGNIGVNSIAFSGGVFQNAVLVDLVKEHLVHKFELYFHKQLSPNDENISLGQLAYYSYGVDGIQTEEMKNNEKIIMDINKELIQSF
ncbi:MAG: carbamoyltransferase HypF [Chitinophagaceae bacterium]|jgi:hydrogenase maturation protein HypF|nr:carbamoyltransferase HypF [Chitinophagaceae bacterium]